MTNTQAYAIAEELDLPEKPIEIFLQLGFDADELKSVLKAGLESGKLKTREDIELEILFGL